MTQERYSAARLRGLADENAAIAPACRDPIPRKRFEDTAAALRQAAADAEARESPPSAALEQERAAPVALSPAVAAEKVCHEEQLRVWAHEDIIGALALGDFLRDDLSYDDGIEMERCVMQALKSVVQMAFDHPEARTIIVRRDP